MEATIAILPGDGIGPEIVREATKALEAVAQKFGHSFAFAEADIGGVAIDHFREPLPGITLTACKKADAVLLGAVGGPRWENVAATMRPEAGLLALRKELKLYANIRPVHMYKQLLHASPLKEEHVRDIDFVVVRELTGGLYFGAKGINETAELAFDNMSYSRAEIERCARRAFELALTRKGKLTLVDKENVLCTSKLWRRTVKGLEHEYPDVEVDYMYVDNAAMQLVMAPGRFDVLLTENMFGDILSDEASVITGSIGLLPSASIGEDAFGLYEPIHGSAPDIANQNIANPMATILSAALLLRMSLGLGEEADVVEKAVAQALADGVRTADIASPGEKALGTSEAGAAIVQRILA